MALDHYAWSFDTAPMVRYLEECRKKSVAPEPYEQVPGMWRPDELPGKKGFDTAHEILRSKVEPVVHDFMTVDLDRLGTFDVVLYLGVLYHIHNPFEALKRVARVTKELAIIETEAVVVPGFEDRALFEFYETNELNGDASNWWAPNQKGLVGMCRAAGFKKAEMQAPPPPQPPIATRLPKQSGCSAAENELLHFRAVVHAWK